MGDSEITGSVTGIEGANSELEAMRKRVDKASQAAIRKVQSTTKASIKSGMRGRPRWDRRGRSKIYAMGVNLNLSPHVVSKQGGPGTFAGALFKSIRSSKKARNTGTGEFSGVVFSGGAGGPQNLYKKRVEAKFPYFAPGVNKAQPKFAKVWEDAWKKATKTGG
ncbi:hypothetical protein P3T36_002991 [Kitasatospora sp. MAP12-15]|uniref:hypothetical protein n=1 Tax=unclassified Kitasatospora TaxID=2633591 RepID=UPI0024736EE5|nr:hypothetical protein [Kitasatospora sp. MAP12-44]MDH6108860.1 hypothetical protein [Kitasatospora sp. MAP12-44]